MNGSVVVQSFLPKRIFVVLAFALLRRLASSQVGASVVCLLAATTAMAQAPLAEPVARASEAVIDAIRAQDFAAVEARFDANMHRALPHDRFMAVSAQITTQIGSLQECDAPRGRARGGVTTVEVRCRFANGPALVRLAWNDGLELTGLFILPVPPEAAKPAPLPPDVREEAVTTGAPGWPLPGTLLVPTSRSTPPVVVLVHGSGPNDRDETIGPNRPFLDLALGFAAKGIASLRYDKRTRALGDRFAAELKNYTLDDEIVDDAVAAVLVAAGRGNLGPVFIVGHSEGAWLAPRIAKAAAVRGVDVAGIVMLAAPLTPVADLLVYQYEFLSNLPGPGVTSEMIEDVKRRRDNVTRLIERAGDPARMTIADTGPLPLDAPASLWLDMGRYDPVAALLSQPGLPALLTFGERDFQVPISEKALWQARLGARPNTTIVAYPGLTHLLIDGEGPMSPAEYGRPGHVSPKLIDGVADWIDRQSPGKR